MTNRVLDISDRPARLSARGGLLVINFGKPWGESKQDCKTQPPGAESTKPDDAGQQRSVPRDPESGLRARDTETYTVPFEDVAVVVVSHPQVIFSQAVLAGLAAAGGMFIVSDSKHLPAAMMLPLSTHSTQTERFARQAAVPQPTRKRAWQQIMQAKIRAQGLLLEELTGSDRGLLAMAAKVRSGDPDNLEAQAARVYWQAVFTGKGAAIPTETFRRDPEGLGLNLHLNYGYAVLRAVVARALCAAGLHPSLGVHHHNRYDTFCLADDLMEPYRPLVDRVVARLARETPPADVPPPAQLDQNSKKAILGNLLVRYGADGESRTLFDWVSRSANSLAAMIEDREEQLSFARLLPSAKEDEHPE